MNILYNNKMDSRKLLKDFFIVDCEGRKDGRFNMHNTIDYISAYMPFEMIWSIRVPFDDYIANVWVTEGNKGYFSKQLLTKYCGLEQADIRNPDKIKACLY